MSARRFLANWLGAAVCLAAAAGDESAFAQKIDLGDSAEGVPIQIEAERGIEWRDEYSVVTARGNAKAIRGDVQVRADSLSAYYREEDAGKTEVWLLEALGDVQITSPKEEAFADRGTYDVGRAVLVLSGESGVRLNAEDGEVTADDQVEYWERDQMLVARGNAHARQGDRGLQANVLVAYLNTDDSGQTRLSRVEAFDNVFVYTPEERVRAERGVYVVDTNVASLVGSVRIARGVNQLSGCRAEVNLESGVSKLFGCEGGSRGNQVRGLIQPDKEPDKETDRKHGK